jgi:hypothetical protein
MDAKEKKLTIHQSTLATISRCGMQAYYLYIEGIRSAPGVAALTGTATHKAVERNLREKMRSGNLLPVEEVRQAACEAVLDGWQGEVLLSDEEQGKSRDTLVGETIDRAVKLAELHAANAAPRIDPTACEQVFRLETKGRIALEGTVDVVEGNKGVLRDTKTSGKAYAADAAANSIQKDFYALMAEKSGLQVREFKLDVLVGSARKLNYQEVSSQTPTDHEPLLRRIDAAVRVFDSGAFMPADPTDWCCSPKWCGYWSRCPYGERRRRQFSVASDDNTNSNNQ